MRKRRLPSTIRAVLGTVALGIVGLCDSSPSSADFFRPQVVGPGGGTVYITALDMTPYAGSNLEVGPSNAAVGTAWTLLGGVNAIGSISKAGNGQNVFSAVVSVSKEMTTTLSCTSWSVLTVHLPTSIALSTPLQLYIASLTVPQPMSSNPTPIPVAWSSPISGERDGASVHFMIANLTIPYQSNVFMEVTQGS